MAVTPVTTSAAQLHVGELGPHQLAIHLLGHDEVRSAHEAREEPHDEEVRVRRARGVEGDDVVQAVHARVGEAHDEAVDDLQAEQQHAGREEVPGDSLRFVLHVVRRDRMRRARRGSGARGERGRGREAVEVHAVDPLEERDEIVDLLLGEVVALHAPLPRVHGRGVAEHHADEVGAAARVDTRELGRVVRAFAEQGVATHAVARVPEILAADDRGREVLGVRLRGDAPDRVDGQPDERERADRGASDEEGLGC
jgi:hypothetical protein